MFLDIHCFIRVHIQELAENYLDWQHNGVAINLHLFAFLLSFSLFSDLSEWRDTQYKFLYM